jgi:integrase
VASRVSIKMTRRPIKRLIDDDIKKARVVQPKDFKKLIFIIELTRNPERNKVILFLLFMTGFRVTEVACIRIKDVLWPNGNIRDEARIPAKYTKTGTAGHVFFYNRKLVKAIDEYLFKRIEKKQRLGSSNEYRGLDPESPLVLSEKGTGYSLKKKKRTDKDGNVREYWAADTLQEVVGMWGKEAGIEGFSSHSGRRTFCTKLTNKSDVSEEMLCALLRHETDNMPYVYFDFDDEFARSVMGRMYSED